MAVGAYVRVSSRDQNDRLQRDAIRAWARAKGVTVRWYTDKFTGKTLDRPGWTRLERDLAAGKIDAVVVWKLDRLGRTAAGLTKLFQDFQARGVTFVSLTENIDLSTHTGRMVANILASVAEWEREVRAERQAAGIAAAKAAGKRWGGSKKGKAKKLNADQIRTIKRLHADGQRIAAIARSVGVSRPTVYAVVRGQVTA